MKDGGVGAGAVMMKEGTVVSTLKVSLGTDKEHEVYEAEVVGLQLGFRLLEMERRRIKAASVYTDNQAVLKTLQSGKASQLTHLFVELGLTLDKVRKKHRGIRIESRWIPGHEGVEGNERADEEARSAGEGNSSADEKLPKNLQGVIPVNPTAAKRTYKATLLTRWQRGVKDTPVGNA